MCRWSTEELDVFTFIVVKREVKPILGLNVCEKTHRMKRINGVEAANKDDNTNDDSVNIEMSTRTWPAEKKNTPQDLRRLLWQKYDLQEKYLSCSGMSWKMSSAGWKETELWRKSRAKWKGESCRCRQADWKSEDLSRSIRSKDWEEKKALSASDCG